MAVTRLTTTTQRKDTANTTSGDLSHTVDSGTDLLIVCIAIEGIEAVSGTPQWSLGGGENLTLIHDTGSNTSNNNVRTYVYGLVSPTSGAGTVDIVYASSCNPAWSCAVNYSGTDTTSVAAATDNIIEDNNTANTASSLLGNQVGDNYFIFGAFQGQDGSPASNNVGFNEVFDDTTGGSSSADFAIYYADLLGTDTNPTVKTITWSTSDQNCAKSIRLNDASGVSHTRNPDAGSLTLAGAVPTVERSWTIPAPVGSLTLTGLAPSVLIAANVPIPAGALTLTGSAPTVEKDFFIPVPAGSLTLSGSIPVADVSVDRPTVGPFQLAAHGLNVNTYGSFSKAAAITRAPGAGTLTISGSIPSLERSWVVTPGSGALTISGSLPTVERSWTVVGSLGSLTLAGSVPTLQYSFTAVPPAATLTLTGFAPTVGISLVIPVPAGSLTITGLAPTAERSWTVVPGTGTAVLTGITPLAITTDNHVRAPPAGSLTVTGAVPVAQSGDNHIAQPGVGSLTLSGLIPTATTTQNHVIPVPAGSLTLAGSVPVAQTGDDHIAQPTTGTLTLSGTAPTVERSWTITPPAGSLTLSGSIPVAQSGNNHIALPAAGSLTLSGSIPSLERSWTIDVPATTLTAAGLAPILLAEGSLVPGVGSLSLTGYAPITAVTVDKTRELGPHGLVAKYSVFSRELSISPVGAQTNAEAGNVTVDVTVVTRLSELGPHGLTSKERNFAPKQGSQQNVDATIAGAEIVLEWNYPDSADVAVYTDGNDIDAEGGSVTDDVAFVTTAAMAGEAGTVAVDVSSAHSITGAQINGEAADVTAIGGTGAVDVTGTPTGAQIAGEAGTITPTYDWAQTITGAQINGQASEVGLDFRTGVSPTIVGAQIDAEAQAPALAGPHVTVNIVGARTFCEAGEVEQVRKRGGGKGRKRRRYIVEIDGQLFDAISPQHAQQILRQAAETVEETPQVIEKAPVIRVKTATGTAPQSKLIEREVKQARTRIRKALSEQAKRVAVDREISQLLQARFAQEDDDEDALLVLLL